MDGTFSMMMRKKDEVDKVENDKNNSTKTYNQPWVEKYRPKKVDDVVYQEEVVSVLKNSLQGSDFPNLLFYGPPGTGKTSTILALAHEMFTDIFKQRVLELNASDERGISVIRQKVKNFAQQTSSSIRSNGKSCAPFKIIVLDEADSMTNAAQSALRRIMEKESKNTRFCLICNYISRIIEPIASRCAKFRFKPLTKDCIFKKLKEICEFESVQLENDQVIDELIKVSEGDLRKAITMLQTAFRMKLNESKITLNDIDEISGHIPEEWINKIIEAISNKSYESIEIILKELMAEGYSASQLLIQIHEWILSDKSFLNDKQKSVVCECVARAEHYLLEGANEYLQSFYVMSKIIQQVEA